MHIYTDEIERLRGSIVTRGWGKKNCGRFRGSIVKWICCSISTMGGGGSAALEFGKEGNVIIVERIN